MQQSSCSRTSDGPLPRVTFANTGTAERTNGPNFYAGAALILRILVLGTIVAVLASATSAGAQVPPSGLTRNGRVIWNLDALLRDTYGNRLVCWDGQRFVLFPASRSAGCPAPSARYQTWDFSFLNTHHSQFRRIHLLREPTTGVTNVPIRVGSDYVSCPHGQYHHGRRGWLVFGGGAGPTGLFWCN